MAEYKWEAVIEGTIKIVDIPTREPPSLNNQLCMIKYKISAEDTEIELHRHHVLHGDSDGPNSFHQGSIFGRYSKRGTYTLRSYNRYSHKDLEITGRELRENMNTLLRQVKECWAAGNHCPTHLDHSRNFWANGDLELLEEILKRETGLPKTVEEMFVDLAGVEYKGK